jgi:hypothetical protein
MEVLPLEVLPLRLDFNALDSIHFPPGKAANVLRGALGMALAPELFAPRSGGGPSGLADPPRSFVFRCRHLDGATIRAGASFHFHLNLFLPAAREALVEAFRSALRERAELRQASGEIERIELSERAGAPDRVRVEFLSPTELKHEGRLAGRPEFPILIARIRDRVSALRALYGEGALEIDFAGMGARAAAVRMTRCELASVEVERRSSRTGQTHPIGGFTGVAEYEGPLGEFLPYLEAARWTGVGRQAVWGKGEIAAGSA